MSRTVIVTVRSGCADVAYLPEGFDWLLVDFDDVEYLTREMPFQIARCDVPDEVKETLLKEIREYEGFFSPDDE